MSSRHKEWDIACKVYIGNLSRDATRVDVEDSFSKYGPLRNVWVARNPPGFAFVEFEDSRDAEDAVRYLDGVKICGMRVKVEMSNGKTRTDKRERGGSSRRDRDDDRGRRGGGGGGARRYRSRSPRRSRSRSRSPRGRDFGREASGSPYERHRYRTRSRSMERE